MKQTVFDCVGWGLITIVTVTVISVCGPDILRSDDKKNHWHDVKIKKAGVWGDVVEDYMRLNELQNF